MLRVLLPLALSLTPFAVQAAPQSPGVAGVVVSADAGASASATEVRWRAERGPHIGPGEAARLAHAEYGGRVLAVHRIRDGKAYRVRLLIGGQIRVVIVDARNGRVRG
ncbi:hypothetical protein BW247_01020 [Acidihalobacter ferrooxydans]|uniref:PepSY domain-containing protein n=2 Tax=Acidihalobacter ferrooxydans TaxID=1765967 RepID=A0A1P8UDB4_9GAMM|nr:hypothetical protein BW247_01020 [Acidihalobacter ferrooxydans]